MNEVIDQALIGKKVALVAVVNGEVQAIACTVVSVGSAGVLIHQESGTSFIPWSSVGFVDVEGGVSE